MNVAVVTVSDRVSAGEAEDRSGPAIVRLLAELGYEPETSVVPDGVESVAAELRRLAGTVNLIVTTGGTGFTPRDLTPEATKQVIEREVPGMAEAMRAVTFGVRPHGMLSRGVCGIVGSTLIINLPGSPRGATESLEVVAPALRHGLELLSAADSDHNAG